MKLTDLKTSKPEDGVYMALKVLPPSNHMLAEYCTENGIEINLGKFTKRLHSTLIFSRVRGRGTPKVNLDSRYVATVTSFDLFTGQDGVSANVLVARLSCPAMVARHLSLMAEHDFTWDHPTFEPHITLSYDWMGGLSILPPIEFDIVLGDEYMQALSLD